LSRKLDRSLYEECEKSDNYEIEMMTQLNKYFENVQLQMKQLPKVDISPNSIKELSLNIREHLEKAFAEKNILNDELNYIFGGFRIDSRIV